VQLVDGGIWNQSISFVRMKVLELQVNERKAVEAGLRLTATADPVVTTLCEREFGEALALGARQTMAAKP